MATRYRNDFGTFHRTDVWYPKSVVYYKDGTISASNTVTSAVNAACSRLFPSSNPLVPLGDTTSLFRKPSKYYTHATNGKRTLGTYVYRYGPGFTRSHHVREICLNHDVRLLASEARDRSGHDSKLTNIMSQAKTECLQKLGDGKAEIGAALAEAKSTYRLLTNTTMHGLKALKALKRGKFNLMLYHLGLKNRRDVSGMHLAVQYGWLPLMSDILGTKDLLEQQLRKGMLISAKKTTHSDISASGIGIPTGTMSGKITAHVGMIAQLDDLYLRTTQQAGLINPATVAWEVTPFSFVVDWFVPVGSYLSAMTASAGLDFISGYVNFKTDMAINLVYEKHGAGDDWETISPSTLEVEHTLFSRDMLGGFPRSRPYVASPFSTKRALNAIALIHQLTK